MKDAILRCWFLVSSVALVVSLWRFDEVRPVEFGRFESPLVATEVEAMLFSAGRATRFARLKRWQYVSISTDEFFLAAAVADLGHANSFFAFAVEKNASRVVEEISALRPLNLGLEFAKSSVQGCTLYSDCLKTSSFRACSEEDAWSVHVSFGEVKAAFRVAKSPEPLSLAVPLASASTFDRGGLAHT